MVVTPHRAQHASCRSESATTSFGTSGRGLRRRSCELHEVLDGLLELAAVLQQKLLVELLVVEAHLAEVVERLLPLGQRDEVTRARVEVGAVLLQDMLHERIVGKA